MVDEEKIYILPQSRQIFAEPETASIQPSSGDKIHFQMSSASFALSRQSASHQQADPSYFIWHPPAGVLVTKSRQMEELICRWERRGKCQQPWLPMYFGSKHYRWLTHWQGGETLWISRGQDVLENRSFYPGRTASWSFVVDCLTKVCSSDWILHRVMFTKDMMVYPYHTKTITFPPQPIFCPLFSWWRWQNQEKSSYQDDWSLISTISYVDQDCFTLISW